MGWVKVDDQFADHPKFEDLSNDAVALWIRTLAYCNRQMTDGFVKTSTATRLAKSKRPDATIGELVSARLWDVADGGYQVHDFLTWSTPRDERQKKAAEAKARKEAWKARQKAGGTPEERVPDSSRNATGTQTEHVPNASPERDGDAQSEDRRQKTERSPCSPPVGDGTNGFVLEAPVAAKSKRQPKRRESAPSKTLPTAEVDAWLVARGVPPTTDSVDGFDVLRFLNHHRAKGSTFAEWDTAWGNWKSGRFIGGAPAASPPVQRETTPEARAANQRAVDDLIRQRREQLGMTGTEDV